MAVTSLLLLASTIIACAWLHSTYKGPHDIVSVLKWAANLDHAEKWEPMLALCGALSSCLMLWASITLRRRDTQKRQPAKTAQSVPGTVNEGGLQHLKGRLPLNTSVESSQPRSTKEDHELLPPASRSDSGRSFNEVSGVGESSAALPGPQRSTTHLGWFSRRLLEPSHALDDLERAQPAELRSRVAGTLLRLLPLLVIMAAAGRSLVFGLFDCEQGSFTGFGGDFTGLEAHVMRLIAGILKAAIVAVVAAILARAFGAGGGPSSRAAAAWAAAVVFTFGVVAEGTVGGISEGTAKGIAKGVAYSIWMMGALLAALPRWGLKNQMVFAVAFIGLAGTIDTINNGLEGVIAAGIGISMLTVFFLWKWLFGDGGPQKSEP